MSLSGRCGSKKLLSMNEGENMNLKLVTALIIGTVLMLGVTLLCRLKYGFPIWKTVAATALLTVVGVVSVKIMFFVENGTWGGLSFFGAVFLVPFWFLPISLLLRLPYRALLDITAPAICIMLALMKVECLLSGCCMGRVLYETAAGEIVRFPSQVAEFCNALLLLGVLILLIFRGRQEGRIYPWFMVIYGGTRFGLNLFRETKPYVWKLSPGGFWSLVAIALGIMLLVVFSKKDSRRSCQPCKGQKEAESKSEQRTDMAREEA